MSNALIKKYLSSIVIIILVIPILLGYQREDLLLISGNFWVYFISILIGLILFTVGYYCITYFGKNSLEILKKNPVFQNLEARRYLLTLAYFALFMLIEELIFRFYLFSVLRDNWSEIGGLWVASLIFCLYHINIYLQYKDVRLAVIYILFSFILGVYLTLIFNTFGLIGAFIAHFIGVFLIYFFIWKKKI